MLWQGFEIKSYQRRAHYIYPLRNGGQLAARGGSWSLLSLIRVKTQYTNTKQFDKEGPLNIS